MDKYSRRVVKPFPDLYHISFNGKLIGEWTPQPPDGDYDPETDTVSLHGEPLTPRISVAPTLVGCFQGVYANVKHLFKRHPELTFFIYKAEFKGNERVVYPEQLTAYKQVHDAHITQEHCILDPVEMRIVGRVTVPETADKLVYWAFDGPQRGKPYGWLPDLKESDLKVDESRLIRIQDLDAYAGRPTQESKQPTWMGW